MAALNSAARGRQWGSPERTRVWVEPKPRRELVHAGGGGGGGGGRADRSKVPVIYYLCRNGQLEHPHFMEVALSSHEGLFLRDVTERLDALRGKGMAAMYAWSSKRAYKNGYVWHDLAADDVILPVHGNEYVLKGSELVHTPPAMAVATMATAATTMAMTRDTSSSSNSSVETATRKMTTSWSSIDLAEYQVFKKDPSAADAATQTAAELASDEISPPPSSASPDTLEALIKSARPLKPPVPAAAPPAAAAVNEQTGIGAISGGRMRASAMIMQLISCGSIAVKDGSGVSVGVGVGAVGGSSAPSRVMSDVGIKKSVNIVDDDDGLAHVSFSATVERDYFSGSIVELRKAPESISAVAVVGDGDSGGAALKRSSSYNADRTGGKSEVEEAEEEAARALCIPRPRARATAAGSKRFAL